MLKKKKKKTLPYFLLKLLIDLKCLWMCSCQWEAGIVYSAEWIALQTIMSGPFVEPTGQLTKQVIATVLSAQVGRSLSQPLIHKSVGHCHSPQCTSQQVIATALGAQVSRSLSQSLVHKLVCHCYSPWCTSQQVLLIIIIIIINPLTARVVGAPQMILQPVFSIFPCSPLPSGTCRTPGLSIL